MSDTPDKSRDPSPPFLHRWSQRKHQQQCKSEPQPLAAEAPADSEPPVPFNEADLPPIETLQQDSEVSMFLHDSVSDALRRAALRKLFHMAKFNVCDGLDDYADDYAVYQPLQEVLTVRKKLRDVTAMLDQQQAETEPAGDQGITHSETITAEEESSDVQAIQDEQSEEG